MTESKIKITVFAGLKDFFEPQFEMDHSFATVEEVAKQLVALNPNSESLLKKCRFAVDNSFVNLEFGLEATSELLVLPPSSGG